MIWRIDFSASAQKFLKKNNLEENFVIDKVSSTIRKFKGERVNSDVKKLGGAWDGFYRVRSGRLRIIVEFRFERSVAYIEVIDWRGNVYK